MTKEKQKVQQESFQMTTKDSKWGKKHHYYSLILNYNRLLKYKVHQLQSQSQMFAFCHLLKDKSHYILETENFTFLKV